MRMTQWMIVLILFSSGVMPAYAERKDDFSTSYIAPSGKMGKIRLMPRADILNPNPCVAGMMYVSARTGKLNFCLNGVWRTFDSAWAQSGNSIYPVRTISKNDPMKLGIGTTQPRYKLHVVSTAPQKKLYTVFFNGVRGALRVGKYSDNWSDGRLGLFSFAAGEGTTASYRDSFAVGYRSRARNLNAFAVGKLSLAMARGSFAFGQGGEVTGLNSIAFNLEDGARIFDQENTFQIAGDTLIGSVDVDSTLPFSRIIQIYGDLASTVGLKAGAESYFIAGGQQMKTMSGGSQVSLDDGMYVSVNEGFTGTSSDNRILMSMLDSGNTGFMRMDPQAYVHFGTAADNSGSVLIRGLAGDNSAFVCIDPDGQLFRSTAECSDDISTSGGLESCDGIDNDHNGLVDDNPSGVGNPCTSGYGVCQADGSYQCIAGVLVCDAVAGTPTTEICGNGIDEDCDGADLFASGSCNADFDHCTVYGNYQCINGAIVCDVVAPVLSAEDCDGLDNDCNGLIDDNFEGSGDACSEGIGACETAGVIGCRWGGLYCDVGAGGTPTTEICGNSIDEDCDGSDLDC